MLVPNTPLAEAPTPIWEPAGARYRVRVLIAAAGLALGLARAAHADQVVQIPVDSLLTGRAVSTFTGSAVVPWTVGVDQNDGFVTVAAEAYLKQTGVALPDDGTFPADATHPEIVLHFSNAAPVASPQNHYVNGVGSFDIEIPQATYSKMFLFMTDAANGGAATGSPLTVSMTYADATSTTLSFTLPDYGTGAALPAGPPTFFNLISGMHKWNQQDMSVDTPTHALTGIELSPAADKVLTSLQVSKLDTGKVVVFWGATGIATSLVDAGSVIGADGGNSVEASSDGAGGEAEASSGSSGALATSGSSGASGGSGVASAASSAAGATGSTSDTPMVGSGSASGAVTSSGGAEAPNPTSNSGCSFSAAPAARSVLLSASLFVFCGAARRRRRPRVITGSQFAH
jgi:hypothetical protein